ncbi:MAG: hypothetical protein ACP5FH_06065 [Terracidiphilus sp.]
MLQPFKQFLIQIQRENPQQLMRSCAKKRNFLRIFKGKMEKFWHMEILFAAKEGAIPTGGRRKWPAARPVAIRFPQRARDAVDRH